MKDCIKCKYEQQKAKSERIEKEIAQAEKDLAFIKRQQEYTDGLLTLLGNDRRTIKRMAEFISKMDIDEDICKHYHQTVTDCNAEGFDCMECIIEHFRRAENENL